VPPLLHTPLMSGTNAISGISLVGSLVAAGSHHNGCRTILGFIAVTCAATINVVGGFMITDRMLRMFKAKPSAPAAGRLDGAKPAKALRGHREPPHLSLSRLPRRVDPLHPLPAGAVVARAARRGVSSASSAC
jgi:NAD(P) transhydrogenase subunit alpha